MTDQNQAFPASSGSDANSQGEQQNNSNNQTMESLLNEQELNVDLPQPGEIRTGTSARRKSSPCNSADSGAAATCDSALLSAMPAV